MVKPVQMKNTEIKPISDLFIEINDHPDFIIGDFYTFSECLENSNELMEQDEDITDYIPIRPEEIDIELKQKIRDHIINQLYLIFKFSDGPYPIIIRDELTGKLIIE